MITIKLMGGARRALGKDRIEIEGSGMSLLDLLQMLREISKESPIFSTANILLAVNGIESSALGGLQARLRDGDVVSVVPVVHGG